MTWYYHYNDMLIIIVDMKICLHVDCMWWNAIIVLGMWYVPMRTGDIATWQHHPQRQPSTLLMKPAELLWMAAIWSLRLRQPSRTDGSLCWHWKNCVVSGVLPMLLYRLNLGNGQLPGLSCLQDDLNPKAARDLALSVQINVSTSNRIFLMFDEVQGIRQRQFQTNAMCSQISSKFSYLLHGMTLGGLRSTDMCVFQWRFIINMIQTTDTLSFKYQMHTLVHHSNNSSAGDWTTLLWQRPATSLASLWTGCEVLGGCRTTGRKPMAAIPGMAWPSNKDFVGLRFHHSVKFSANSGDGCESSYRL